MISSPLMKGALATLLALLINNVANAQKYEVVDLGPNAIPTAINEQGLVAGVKLSIQGSQFFTFKDDKLSYSGNSLLGSASSIALDNLGRALGSVDQSNGLASFVSVSGNKVKPLGHLDIPLLTAISVNYFGESGVAGGAVVSGPEQKLRAFLKIPGISAPLLNSHYTSYSVMLDWHPSGFGVGYHGFNPEEAFGTQYAAKFETYEDYNGELKLDSTYIHSSGGQFPDGCSVKSYNDIAITHLAAGSAECSASDGTTIYKPALRVIFADWASGTIATHFDALAGHSRSEALGVNDHNTVVGFSAADDTPITERATVHRGVSVIVNGLGIDEVQVEGEWEDLNSVANIGANPKLKLLRALKVNNRGDIIGYAAKQGSAAPHGYLLRAKRDVHAAVFGVNN